MEKIVNFVHAIDTEGPLYESLDAKFCRIKELFGIDHIEATTENLNRLKSGTIDLNGIEKNIMQVLNSHLSNYNDSWDKIDTMLERIMATEYRNKLKDSFGGGWVYNWHCVDHVGYEYNPRRRDIGYHNIFDHYKEILESKNSRDAIHWHFHPMSTYKEAHHCATSYINSPELYQILCRKIIERNWFPSVFRAGFQSERPDSHWFLEQWIPFDISNMATENVKQNDKTIDFRNGRSGDWRLAPSDWSVYHPNHDNYQRPGECRRFIGRALNVLNRIASIDQIEMDKAFERADQGLPTLVGFASHDFRDIGVDVDYIRDLIKKAVAKYPAVQFRYCEGVEAFRNVIHTEDSYELPLEFDITYHTESKEDVASIEVICKQGKVFGPQPFLAIQTKSRRFIHDNFDFSLTGDRWYYAFHSDTLLIDDVKCIGVAANDKMGNVCIRRMQF